MAVKKKATKTEEQVIKAPEVMPEITISDLQSIEQIISIASTRGAFKANEMTAVGTVYDRISKFLAYVARMNEEKKAKAEVNKEKTQETTNV